jgi:hypothetical protein
MGQTQDKKAALTEDNSFNQGFSAQRLASTGSMKV